VEVKIINDNSQTAYMEFGSATPTGTYNGGTLDSSTTIAIAANGTVTGVDLTQFESGRLLFSLGSPLSSVDNTNFQNGSGPDSLLRWDKVELSLYPASDTVDQSVADLSATDFFGLEFNVEAINNGTVVGNPLTWNESPIQAFTDLAATATHGPGGTISPYVVVTGTNGLYVPALNENVLRIIAPSTVPPSAESDFTSPQDYINYVQSNGITTEVAGTYSRKGTTLPTETQTYDFTATIPNTGPQKGDLLLIGGGSLVGTGHTIDIAATNVASAIISTDPTYTVDGVAADIGQNDVYAAAVTDILGGFNLGFVGSSAINPNSGSAYDATSTASWYSPQLTAADAFSYAQPSQPTFYNQYAAEVSALGDAYGFPFTDLLSGPQLDVTNADTLVITVGADNSAPCFIEGTLITTSSGEHPVERLEIGTTIPTVIGGQNAPIIWIGHRTVDCRRHKNPKSVWPVRIRRHAFGPNRPHADLVLSPDHAVFVEGVLIPVRYLIDGASIVQEQVEKVIYYHVELDRHDVLLAHGLPVETFLDTGNRGAFANGGPVVQAHPDFNSLRWEAAGCAPLVVTGEILEHVRAGLRGAEWRGDLDSGQQRNVRASPVVERDPSSVRKKGGVVRRRRTR